MAEFPPFAVTADLVVLTVRDDALQALVIRRGEAPYEGDWALPGGFVRPDEDLDAAAARELAEETGLSRDHVHLEQLASYGAPDRDPRMRVVTVAYIALAADLPSPNAGTDAADARWQPVDELLAGRRLAFDHTRILRDGVERARAKLEYTPLATAFCPREFTIAELRRVYEVVWGAAPDPRNFHRKATKTEGFVEPTELTTTRDGGRPARLYRAGRARHLHPPLLRGGEA
ncbi:8-oxo-dGTP diphosphatase [Saccharopolyspora antimicrobica]|uniref:8-oxo-dGTP diphosphatase n=1 Tax=Saccharopolyspora antimicrobica TaxID=455193 RepID=A0A1I5DXB1_9PSEU|nr:NUDIX domain-containing protein [Saccharopolyspora antimicrobica]RKT84963.1 8-oxo-dGTP diphosphatase [Saccharopolyspora antimicrobica]SFO03451.1 8-oxo-dGTP diphosphatase [Saccharopolyspora antimicrobica]